MLVESVSDFPFHRLRHCKFLILHVMMYVDRQEVLQFIFDVNKKARNFLEQNFITIRNGFINEGLIHYNFKNYENMNFYHYE